MRAEMSLEHVTTLEALEGILKDGLLLANKNPERDGIYLSNDGIGMLEENFLPEIFERNNKLVLLGVDVTGIELCQDPELEDYDDLYFRVAKCNIAPDRIFVIDYFAFKGFRGTTPIIEAMAREELRNL